MGLLLTITAVGHIYIFSHHNMIKTLNKNNSKKTKEKNNNNGTGYANHSLNGSSDSVNGDLQFLWE